MTADDFQQSPEAAFVMESVNRRGITEFFHFTPIEAVPSILAHEGIHPRTVLRERGIPFDDDPGRWSNDLRKAAELEPYVATGIARPWGMMKDYPDCVVFSLKPRLLWRLGTSFIGVWSSSSEIQGIADVEARERAAAFDAMFDNPAAAFPAPLPGEVLVRGTIGLHDVKEVVARDQDHAHRIREVVKEAHIRYHGPRMTLSVKPYIYPARRQ